VSNFADVVVFQLSQADQPLSVAFAAAVYLCVKRRPPLALELQLCDAGMPHPESFVRRWGVNCGDFLFGVCCVERLSRGARRDLVLHRMLIQIVLASASGETGAVGCPKLISPAPSCDSCTTRNTNAGGATPAKEKLPGGVALSAAAPRPALTAKCFVVDVTEAPQSSPQSPWARDCTVVLESDAVRA